MTLEQIVTLLACTIARLEADLQVANAERAQLQEQLAARPSPEPTSPDGT